MIWIEVPKIIKKKEIRQNEKVKKKLSIAMAAFQ